MVVKKSSIKVKKDISAASKIKKNKVPVKKSRVAETSPPKKAAIKKTPSRMEKEKIELKEKNILPSKMDQKISKKGEKQPEVSEITSSPTLAQHRVLTAEGWKRMQLKKRQKL